MEAKKEGFVIASEEPSDQVSEQVEAQQVDSSEATEEVTADSSSRYATRQGSGGIKRRKLLSKCLS